LDKPLDRIVMLTSPRPYEVSAQSFRVGKNVAAVEASLDRAALFVLSKGVQPRRNPDDEFPSVTVLDAGTSPKFARRYELTDPMQELAVDPQQEWLVAFNGDSTVTNPNEFVLLALDDAADEGRSVTIRSFGGEPKQVLFTDPLVVPKGPARRFLIVRTDRDIALIDLRELDREEVTVQTPVTAQGTQSVPVEVVFDPGVAGDAGEGRYARVGVRLQGESDVMLLELGEAPEGKAKDFEVKFNIVDVGGVPSAIEFVNTDFGLRLAALVPDRRQAKLIDPQTTVVESVNFPRAYSRLTRVTSDVDEDSGELALLYSPDAPGIGFWALGRASGSLSKSVEHNEIDLAVAAVRDVPGSSFGHLKILQGANSSRFFVLDLLARQTFPMLTEQQGFRVNVAPDGQRAWAYRNAGTEFASIDLADLHPTSLSVSVPVSAVHDIERSDGSRAALALHGTDSATRAGTMAVTLFDAEAPDSADTRFFGGLLLEGL
jgi:hypothetical protein